MNNKDMSLPNPELLTYVQTGVLWIKDDPIYVIDLVKKENIAIVHVFAVHDKKDQKPKKRAVLIRQQVTRFSPKTKLGELANNFLPAKTIEKWVVSPPLFTAPIVQGYRDTFSQRQEPGFFEREPDTETAFNGERKIIRGKNTGVFIGLSSIVWEDKIRISQESLAQAITQYRQGNSFYDFTGRDDDPNNPLSNKYNGNL